MKYEKTYIRSPVLSMSLGLGEFRDHVAFSILFKKVLTIHFRSFLRILKRLIKK